MSVRCCQTICQKHICILCSDQALARVVNPLCAARQIEEQIGDSRAQLDEIVWKNKVE